MGLPADPYLALARARSSVFYVLGGSANSEKHQEVFQSAIAIGELDLSVYRLPPILAETLGESFIQRLDVVQAVEDGNLYLVCHI